MPVREPIYTRLTGSMHEIKGEIIDASKLLEWMVLWEHNTREIFLHAHDLDYANAWGGDETKYAPLLCTVLNDDRNPWLRAVKKEFFESDSFRALPEDEQQKIKHRIGVPPEVIGHEADMGCQEA